MSSPGRTEFKSLKSLTTLKGRRKHGLFLAEGVRILEESCRFGIVPQCIYFAETDLDKRGKALVDTMARSKCECKSISRREIAQLAESVTPQGIVAVFKIPDIGLNKSRPLKNEFILYLDNIADPGNVGTLIRSTLAFDVGLVVLSPATVDPYNGKVIRASAGTIFGQKLAIAGIDELLEWAGKGAVLIGAQRGGINIRRALTAAKAECPMIFAIGSEAHGLSDECRKRVNHTVGIEHSDKVESLNAAVAGSIILKEIYDYLRGQS